VRASPFACSPAAAELKGEVTPVQEDSEIVEQRGLSTTEAEEGEVIQKRVEDPPTAEALACKEPPSAMVADAPQQEQAKPPVVQGDAKANMTDFQGNVDLGSGEGNILAGEVDALPQSSGSAPKASETTAKEADDVDLVEPAGVLGKPWGDADIAFDDAEVTPPPVNMGAPLPGSLPADIGLVAESLDGERAVPEIVLMPETDALAAEEVRKTAEAAASDAGRQSAAVRIQAMRRGSLARRKHKDVRKTAEAAASDAGRQSAAVRIQATRRGSLARRKLKEGAMAPRSLQTTEQGATPEAAMDDGKAAIRDEQRHSAAAVRIQAVRRGFVMRRSLKGVAPIAVADPDASFACADATAPLLAEIDLLREKCNELQQRLGSSEEELFHIRGRNAELERRVGDLEISRGDMIAQRDKAWQETSDAMERAAMAEAKVASTTMDAVATDAENGPKEALRPDGNDEFNLPDFVWNCGNSEVMAYVQRLFEENSELRKLQANVENGERNTFESKSQPLVAQSSGGSFDPKEACVDRALEFVGAIGESDGHQIESLLTLLKEHMDDPRVCAQVAAALETLTFTDTENRQTIVRHGGVEAVTRAMDSHQANEAVQRPAMDALWNLTFDEEALDRFPESDLSGIGRVADTMRRHSGVAEIQGASCAVLLNLAVREHNRTKIAQCGALELIGDAMRQHASCEEVLEQGCQALYMLAYHPELRPLVVAAKGGEAGALAASHKCGRAQKWGRWLQEVLAC